MEEGTYGRALGGQLVVEIEGTWFCDFRRIKGGWEDLRGWCRGVYTACI